MKKSKADKQRLTKKAVMATSIALIATTTLFAGCSKISKNDIEKSSNETAQTEINASEDSKINEDKKDDILIITAEKDRNEGIEKAFRKYMEFTDEEFDKTRYDYNIVDLNNDGNKEAFVLLMGMFTSGSGGSTALIMEKGDTEEWGVKQRLTLINTPIIISDNVTNGWKDIITYKAGGGAKASHVKLVYKDGKYNGVNDGDEIENLDGITGKSILGDYTN